MHGESLAHIKKEYHGTYRSYVVGFVVSLILTGASFGLVVGKVLEGAALVWALVGLALVQASCQLIYFLHLGQEEAPRWESLLFYFMLLVLLIVVLGTLWIMFDLDNRTMGGMAM